MLLSGEGQVASQMPTGAYDTVAASVHVLPYIESLVWIGAYDTTGSVNEHALYCVQVHVRISFDLPDVTHKVTVRTQRI